MFARSGSTEPSAGRRTTRQTTALAAIAALALYPLGAETASRPEAHAIACGHPATVNDYPAVVLLVGVTERVRACTGSLVGDLCVRAAAHFVDGLPMGKLVVSHGHLLYHEIRYAAEAFMHPRYEPLEQPYSWAHDLAMVRMESKFLSRPAGTAAIADSLDSLSPQLGAAVLGVGWAESSRQA